MPYAVANSSACLPACLPACQFDMATPRANLGRDDRLRILTLRDTGLSHAAIAIQLHLSHRQVQYTCHSQQATPKKPKGQPPKLSEEQMDDIIAFISASEINRQKSYHEVIRDLNLDVTVPTLRHSLKKKGYIRCKALHKPPLTLDSKCVCLAWESEHVNWNWDQWKNVDILWTDET